MMAFLMKKQMKNRRNLLLWRPQRWPLSPTHSQPLSFSLRKGASATSSASDHNDHGHGKSQQNQGYHLLSLSLSLFDVCVISLFEEILILGFGLTLRPLAKMDVTCLWPLNMSWEIKVTTFRFLSSMSVMYNMAFLYLLFRLNSVRFK